MRVEMLDVTEQYQLIRDEFEPKLRSILESGRYVAGEHVQEFEVAFGAFASASHVIACNSGTSALHASLLALGVKSGDEVIVPANTFIATASAVILAGATPVVVDVDPSTYLIDMSKIESAIGPRTVGVIPVHLYGGLVDMIRVKEIADRSSLWIIEDAAQAHGATRDGYSPGKHSNMATYSFYPGKNLGALGEGGAIVTNDIALARKLRLIINWGSEQKYKHEMFGLNYRMDEIQGAALSSKLKIISQSNERRRLIAEQYFEAIALPTINQNLKGQSVHHVFVVLSERRDLLRDYLSNQGIGTGIHYPHSIHKNSAIANLCRVPEETEHSDRITGESLSIPIHGSMKSEDVDFVVSAVNAFTNQ